jgi:hypothetical protein
MILLIIFERFGVGRALASHAVAHALRSAFPRGAAFSHPSMCRPCGTEEFG